MNSNVPFVRTETILDRIMSHKWEELQHVKARYPMSQIRAKAESMKSIQDFEAKLRNSHNVAIIAECKRSSPSAGTFKQDFDAVQLAQRYQEYGASAVSVLTDTKFFGGSLSDLEEVSKRVSLPLLRKDFIFDPYQLYEARLAGADAILLIVSALQTELFRDLLCISKELQFSSLVEVHDEYEMEQALLCGATLIGINNRDLKTFKTDLAITLKLAPLVPPEVTLVAESGIRDVNDVYSMATVGAHAVLVGETLVRSSNLNETLQSLSSVPRQ